MAATVPVRVDVEISKPLRELIDELREEVKTLRAELAAHPCEVHNHYHSTYYGIQKPYQPYSPPSWSGGWVTATNEVTNVGLPCTVA